jgi:hypothetical protein
MSEIFIFIFGFSRNEKSDFEQLFEFQYVSVILFFHFYFYFVFYPSENCFFFHSQFFDNSPCRVEKAKEQPPTINVQMLFLLWTSTP